MAETTEQRLRALEDCEAIRNLIASYGHLADAGDAQAVAALWIEDGVYAVGGMGEARGRAAIAALIEGPTHRGLIAQGCAHVLGSVSIALAGNRAAAVGHSVVLRQEESGFAVWRASANRWALVRTAAGWLVERRDNAPLDGSEAARALLSLQPAPHPR